MGAFGPLLWLIIAAIIFLLFGNRLPDVLGQLWRRDPIQWQFFMLQETMNQGERERRVRAGLRWLMSWRGVLTIALLLLLTALLIRHV